MGAQRSGWHFLQIPGPTNVPSRVLRAIAEPTIDHRSPDFAELVCEVQAGLRWVMRTSGPVVVYAGSGSGGWEAALVNTLSPGARILVAETGFFALGWADVARRMHVDVEVLPGDWRRGADASAIEERLAADSTHRIQAVAVVHSETSTGAATRIGEVRRAMDRAGHPALLFVDAVSSLGCMDYRHDEWRVDVTVAGSQKGLMLPPGLAFNAVSEKAREAGRTGGLPRAYWDWEPIIAANESGFYPTTPSTNLLFGLREALAMLREYGLEQTFARHARHAQATRRAVETWGLEIQCTNPHEYSDVLTAVRMPEGHDADRVRQIIFDRFNMSLGTGLGKLNGRVIRIGHLGDFNDLMLAATLSGVEAGLMAAGVPIRRGGVDAALADLAVPE
ncbi:MAG: aminotransferase class V-fold PLP-dependent enzyme [Gemmatimonadetes bacterium]|nr:aminotransferase class V-fold PLP-dependent enzyme [Gemmatimonadota bacterium]